MKSVSVNRWSAFPEESVNSVYPKLKVLPSPSTPKASYIWEMPTTKTSDSSQVLLKTSIDRQPNHPNITNSKKGTLAKSSLLASAITVPVLATVGGMDVGAGVFWETFMKYIFPWMMDIAKVWCAIKIAQAFYQENQGGGMRGGGSQGGGGMASFVTYGKWYLLFWMIPWGVELIDQIGGKMFNDLTTTP